METSAFKIVAFDCDGVMFDTEAANRAYYNDILGHFKKSPMTDAQFAYCQMHTVYLALRHLFPDEKEYVLAHEFRKKKGYGPYIRYMEMEPDLKDVLCWCRSGLKTAVATNRSDTMGRVLEEHGLKGCFDLVVTALDVKNPKPHPEQLLCILNHFEADPGQLLYIGDSELDQAAARQARVVFAAYGNAGLEADYHITRLSEIRNIAAGHK